MQTSILTEKEREACWSENKDGHKAGRLKKKQTEAATESNSISNLFTASNGDTTSNEVAEKAGQSENETLVEKETLPVAANDSADERRRDEAQIKLQACLKSIPNGTFISRLPFVNDDDDGGLSLDTDSDNDSEYGDFDEGDDDELDDDDLQEDCENCKWWSINGDRIFNNQHRRRAQALE